MSSGTRRSPRVPGWRGLPVLAALGLAACGGSQGGATPPTGGSTSAASCAAGPVVPGTPSLTARLVVSGLRSPLDLQSVAGDRERLYVVEQGGTIRVVRNGQLQPAPFLDVSDRISSGGERGLLGLAFHPQFATNRRLFVNYTDRSGDTHLSEFRAASADAADPASERVLLVVSQPFANHNGGGLAFGNDGRLYAGLGDGGSAGDPLGNGQRLDTLLGKMLRLDVDGAPPYAIPGDNPFRATPGARPEIWAYGLRNPFRFAFDRTTGDLYVGDVGQGAREEVDLGSAARRGGENYGWNVMEGTQCYRPASGCDRTGLTLPVYDYGHDQGCSITGGVVYRGCRMPELAGSFFFGDYCSGFVRSLKLENGQWSVREWPIQGIQSVSSFGTDADGEAYVVDYGGSLFRLEP
jgi:glucose/arabinose dehydrogenase